MTPIGEDVRHGTSEGVDILSLYLEEIARTQLLRKEEEQALAADLATARQAFRRLILRVSFVRKAIIEDLNAVLHKTKRADLYKHITPDYYGGAGSTLATVC